MKNINIVAGGPSHLIPDLSLYQEKNTLWIGVDRGAAALLEAGIVPDEAFGDFDSITEEQKKALEKAAPRLHIYQAEKDKTDLDLALSWSIEQQPSSIRMFGISGGRADHFLGNLQLLYQTLPKKVTTVMIDRQNEISMFSPGSYTVKQDETKPYVSFLPFAETVKNLSLEGFKYSLNKCHIALGSTLCISNELIHSQGAFSFTEGILIMIRSTD
ncbi:thiamine diphosphokinase [Bacillus swezeyi]|uniref:Thiamine diphosphokinase n=1 Tax=Bacillus swezeyi TaxID=1925020 RepID=A0A1R1QUL6_9BACI|nr:thiamine diphosphokinase [Bacillus swezeyi]MEC1260825.1 thiamine diphosphokinase [Bacillus swezeyi]MED2928762.1 thiamine diphosphokinase [Bacillus swezeyi]MED2964284.1 thiamine diphosphokinase [Bacillus swezeyi]MED2975994.1 thiamine diphosphokinase [Bacillus swezeyi]MED3072558.1 thiamine diphosphokinase [Bacillus swezeyi]